LNYQPDILARRLASKQKCRFGILFPKSNPDSSFWQTPLEGVQKAIREIDFYNLAGEEFLFNPFDRFSFSRQARLLVESKPDGILMAPVFYEESVKLVTTCRNLEIPYIFINSTIDGLNDYGFVGQDSFQSGFLAAKLLTYGMPPESSFCLINLARSLNNHKHIMGRQKGFEEYFNTRFSGRANVYIYDIEDTGETEVNESLSHIFLSHANLNGVFVTNSRVYKVARFLKSEKHKSVRLVGYDLINENIEFLEDGTVDFLISQKPFDQGYMGIRALFNLVILQKPVNREYYLPIEILTRENYRYHRLDILKEGL
jgi:LacI family transcriptional regulator